MTEFIFYICVSVIVIMLASLIGAIFAWKTLGTWLRPILSYFIALAIGIFVVIIFNLVQEIAHEGFTFTALLAFLFGGLLLEGITHLLPKDSHHHHHDECKKRNVNFSNIDARRVLIGDAVHNIHDGLTLVPAFLVSPVIGIGTTLGILLHEIVQEIAEFFILKEAGYSTKKALLWNFAVSATIIIGVALALFVASVGDYAVYLVAFSAGGFSYVLIRDLLPSVLMHTKNNGKHYHYIFMVALGFSLMIAVSQFAPHGHNELHEEDFFLPEGFGLAANMHKRSQG